MVPVVGGIVSGGITLASILPMGNRLLKTLDKAHFDYSEMDFDADMKIINEVSSENKEEIVEESEQVKNNIQNDKGDIFEQMQKAKQMLDAGIINEEEFSAIKVKLIAEM